MKKRILHHSFFGPSFFWIFLNFLFLYEKLRKFLFQLTLKSLIENGCELSVFAFIQYACTVLTESSQLLFCWSAV